MKSAIALLLATSFTTAAMAQSPSSSLDRGNSLQSWQDPALEAVLAQCAKKPAPFRIGPPPGAAPAAPPPAPPPPALPRPEPIASVLAAGQQWKVVWSWEGNNADGPIAGPDGTLLLANQDASNVMQLDPATGLAKIIHADTNTGGAVSRSRGGALFVASRGVGAGILQLEPQRRIFANRYNGEPLDCVGGVPNDLAAHANGSVYLAISGGGLFHAAPDGAMKRYGEFTAVNGIVLSPDERRLYVTNGPGVVAFDVRPDGSLANQRDFASLRGGRAGDGSAVDAAGRLYVSTGNAVEVFGADGAYLGTIAGPQGLHGVAFGGRDRRTLYGIVFYGTWGTAGARNQVIALPMLAQGLTDRAK